MTTATNEQAHTSLTSRRNRMSPSQRRDLIDGLFFSSPYILALILLWLGPMLYSIYLVTQDWNLIKAPKYVGLGNFERMLGDPLVSKTLVNTAYYTFLGVPLQLATAFGLALLLNQNVRGQSIYRTIYYIPSITPAVASAVIWIQILNPQFGVLNAVLGFFGVAPIKWLFDPTWAKPAFVLMSLWFTGAQMIIFLAGLQSVPVEVMEAAQIDGANTWRRFWNVTVPVISPVIFFNLVMGLIGSFQVFTSSFIMTKGGPQNSTLFMVLYIYRNAFEFFRMGYAASLAWVLFLIILVFTGIQFVVGNRWVYYEGKV
ncbi:MAG: carbohydrate ABC transporter permease [Anaerolineae bacterium]